MSHQLFNFLTETGGAIFCVVGGYLLNKSIFKKIIGVFLVLTGLLIIFIKLQ